MFRITDAAIQEIKAKYPNTGDDVSLLETPLGDVVVRKCSFNEFQRFQDQVGDKKLSIAQEMLIKACVVWPDGKTFSDGLGGMPAAQNKIAEEILKLSGQRDDIIVRKL